MESPRFSQQLIRSRPSPGQRESALLGVAEALGHPHPYMRLKPEGVPRLEGDDLAAADRSSRWESTIAENECEGRSNSRGRKRIQAIRRCPESLALRPWSVCAPCSHRAAQDSLRVLKPVGLCSFHRDPERVFVVRTSNQLDSEVVSLQSISRSKPPPLPAARPRRQQLLGELRRRYQGEEIAD